MQQNNSEVAHLVAQITAEYEAAQNALHGFASGAARHNFINARMNRIGTLKHELASWIGNGEALTMIGRVMLESEKAQ